MNALHGDIGSGSASLWIAGIVSAWNSITRLLEIGEHQIWVAPDVPSPGLAVGVNVTALGHEDPGGRRVVTRLMLN